MAQDKGTGPTGNAPRTEREAAADLMEIPGALDGEDDEEQDAGAETQDAGAEEHDDPDGLFDIEDLEEGDGEEDADAEPDQDAEEHEDAPSSREPTITIEEDGKKVVLTAKEVRESRLRHADYTRKTMALADERKATTAEKEQAAREKEAYGKLVTEYRKHLDTVLHTEPDWKALEAEDPQQYLLVKERWREAKAERDAAKAEEDRLAGERQQQDAEAFAKRLDEEATKLLEALPVWKKDQKVAQREGAAIRNFLRRRNLNDQEIASVLSDHRSVLIVRDAALFEQAQRKGKTKIRPVKKGVRSLRPGSTTTAAKSDRANTRAARQRLQETGHVRDAANVFERMTGLLDDGKK